MSQSNLCRCIEAGTGWQAQEPTIWKHEDIETARCEKVFPICSFCICHRCIQSLLPFPWLFPFTVCTEPVKWSRNIICTWMMARVQRCSICCFCTVKTSILALLASHQLLFWRSFAFKSLECTRQEGICNFDNIFTYHSYSTALWIVFCVLLKSIFFPQWGQ